MKTTTPRPGRPVRGSRSGRPIMALLDLLGRRWAMRIVWELRDAHLAFRPLRAACGGISPTVLNTRLGELRDAGIVELDPALGYGLSVLGRELVERFVPLVAWSERWARHLRAG
jgi:DNA-binding HxlR family transcriptional regulator